MWFLRGVFSEVPFVSMVILLRANVDGSSVRLTVWLFDTVKKDAGRDLDE